MTQAERGKRNADMIRLYADGLSYQEIADKFGMTKQNVQQTLAKYGVKSRPTGRHGETFDFSDYVSIIAEMREAGTGIVEIAKTFGLYPNHHQWDEYREYCKQFPRFGGEKRCRMCGFVGDVSYFYNSRESYCKKCRLEYNKLRRKEWTPEQRAMWNKYVTNWKKNHRGLTETK